MAIKEWKCLACEEPIALIDFDGQPVCWVHVSHVGDVDEVVVADHEAVPQCPHTLGPISSCPVCNGRDAAQAEARKGDNRVGREYESMYGGICKDCRRGINPGDLVTMWQPSGMAHAECPS